MMDEMKLRGFVSPEDFEGTDAEKIQLAIKTAHEKDIGKVILKGEYTVDKTVYVYENMHLVFDGAKVTGTAKEPIFANFGLVGKDHQYCFQEDLFYIEGRNNAKVEGDFFFYNAYRIVFDGMDIKGKAIFEFSREIRFENDKFEGENAIVFARGCNNVIMEKVSAKTEKAAIVLDAGLEIGDYCIGKEPDIHDMILKRNELDAPCAFKLEATKESGFYNVFIEDNKATGVGATLGEARGNVGSERYKDVTAVGFAGAKEAVRVNTETYHCLLQK